MAKRLSSGDAARQKCYRSCPWEARLTVESKAILKRAGIFISVGSGKCTHAVLLIYGNSGS